jgi:environmental stress-induced protein Ves
MATSSRDAMTVRSIAASQVPAQAWRNGGGRTRELLAWPSADDWSLRISLADIDADGPFSVFAGTVRWFTVVEGAGVRLSFGSFEHRLVQGSAPLRFDAAEAPGCRLIAGATRDLNLMCRGGDSTMRIVESGATWSEAFAMRGLYAAAFGCWSAGSESRDLEAGTLLWCEDAGAIPAPWRFDARAPATIASAWWLGFTPTSNPR